MTLGYAQLEVESETYMILYACPLGPRSVLVYGDMPFALTGQDQLKVNEIPAQKPILGVVFQDAEPQKLLGIFNLSSDLPEYLMDVSILRPEQTVTWMPPHIIDLSAQLSKWPSFIAQLTPKQRKKLFFVMTQYMGISAEAVNDARFRALLLQTRGMLEPYEGKIAHSFWALPNVLCLDCWLPPEQAPQSKVMLQTPGGIITAKADIHMMTMREQDSGRARALVMIYLPRDLREPLDARTLVTLITPRGLVILENGVTPQHVPDGQLLSYSQNFSQGERWTLRDQICGSLIRNQSGLDRAAVMGLVSSLQHYITAPHLSVVDPALPFGVNIDTIVPVGNEKIFVSGWIRDPLGLLQDITLLSDLGMAFPMTTLLLRHRRDYVDQYYAGSSYADARGEWGFVASVPVADEARKRLQSVAQLYGFRAQVTLKGGMQYVVTPAAQHHDAAVARGRLLSDIAPHTRSHAIADQAVMETVYALQNMPESLPGLRKVTAGILPAKPEFSVILYAGESPERLAAQLAALAQDVELRKAEILLVSDVAAVTQFIESRLKSWRTIYALPLMLLASAHTVGKLPALLAAVNAAQSDQLLLSEAGILPVEPGAFGALATYHLRENKTGITGSLLLHHDGSVMHAGSEIALEENGKALNVQSLYQGYPAGFVTARGSSEPASVNASCVMLPRTVAANYLSAIYLEDNTALAECCMKAKQDGALVKLFAAMPFYHVGAVDTVPSDSAKRYDLRRLFERCQKFFSPPPAEQSRRLKAGE